MPLIIQETLDCSEAVSTAGMEEGMFNDSSACHPESHGRCSKGEIVTKFAFY
jgi:hypothetical protein